MMLRCKGEAGNPRRGLRLGGTARIGAKRTLRSDSSHLSTLTLH